MSTVINDFGSETVKEYERRHRRDKFVCAALTGLCVNAGDRPTDLLVEDAIAIADATIKMMGE